MKEDENDLEQGLTLLGWRFDGRLTTEDSMRLGLVAQKALECHESNYLDDEKRDALSLKAYQILHHQVVGHHERADMVSCTYFNSAHFKCLVPMIDEATICFFRGYYTSSLSLLFVILESALLSVYGWEQGSKKPTFKQLKESVLSLPNMNSAKLSHEILSEVYSRFEAESPNAFLFNRHGLLHGLRKDTKYDEMNCARTLQLFDIICSAEGAKRTALGQCLDMFGHRLTIYERSNENRIEQMLFAVDYGE